MNLFGWHTIGRETSAQTLVELEFNFHSHGINFTYSRSDSIAVPTTGECGLFFLHFRYAFFSGCCRMVVLFHRLSYSDWLICKAACVCCKTQIFSTWEPPAWIHPSHTKIVSISAWFTPSNAARLHAFNNHIVQRSAFSNHTATRWRALHSVRRQSTDRQPLLSFFLSLSFSFSPA